MTTIDTEKLALGWGKIAEGAMEISLAYSAIEPAVARTAATGAGGAKAGQPSSVPVLPTFDELPPEGWDAAQTPATDAPPPLKPQVDAGLGVCPTHGVPWTVKAAGVGKTGKPYSAFWKCAERDADGFCGEKPQPIWKDAHPISEGVAA